jgi:hypothetical protein
VARRRHSRRGRTSQKLPMCRNVGDGETRTRTGDTTIFRESAGPVRRHKLPASPEVFVGVPSLRGPRFRAVPRGFGTLLAPRSPNRQKAADQRPVSNRSRVARLLRQPHSLGREPVRLSGLGLHPRVAVVRAAELWTEATDARPWMPAALTPLLPSDGCGSQDGADRGAADAWSSSRACVSAGRSAHSLTRAKRNGRERTVGLRPGRPVGPAG